MEEQVLALASRAVGFSLWHCAQRPLTLILIGRKNFPLLPRRSGGGNRLRDRRGAGFLSV